MKLIFNSYFMLLYLSNIFNTREMAPVIFFILSLSFSILCSPYLVSSIYDEEMAPPIPFTLFFILLLLFAFLIQLVSFITKRWRHRYHLHYFYPSLIICFPYLVSLIYDKEMALVVQFLAYFCLSSIIRSLYLFLCFIFHIYFCFFIFIILILFLA